ncbi:ladderlectin-like isoform X2 [Pecten maximus]|uniref:ladderlectin-like isoform X2 n=1 Tax=Pecten maximus TaxID=6579 RepID=UPI0014580BCB|nr:ladderlectin-like isoform X2 [Pecten maximus]
MFMLAHILLSFQVFSGIIEGYDCDIVGDSCIKLLSAQLPWAAASAECASEGATLLNIDSNSEQLAIQQFMADQGLDNIWMGINDVTSEGDWRTEDGTNPVGYNNFNGGQPDNYNGNQDCAVVRQSFGYRWDDEECILPVYTVCEMKSVGFS